MDYVKYEESWNLFQITQNGMFKPILTLNIHFSKIWLVISKSSSSHMRESSPYLLCRFILIRVTSVVILLSPPLQPPTHFPQYINQATTNWSWKLWRLYVWRSWRLWFIGKSQDTNFHYIAWEISVCWTRTRTRGRQDQPIIYNPASKYSSL